MAFSPSSAPKAGPGLFVQRLGFYYGWVMVGSSAVTMSIIGGFRFSFTVFYVAILSEFGWDRASTAAIASVNVFTYGALVALSGVFVDRFGPRVMIPVGAAIYSGVMMLSSQASELWHFYLLSGVLGGLGFALCGYIPHFVVLTNWFVKRRGRAYGLAQAGNGTSFLIAALSQVLITAFGWRGAYLFLGGVLGVPAVLLPLVLIRRHPHDLGLQPDGESSEATPSPEANRRYHLQVVDERWVGTQWTLKTVAKTRQFRALFLANLLIWGFGFTLVMTHQAAYARDAGHSQATVALMLGLYGVVNIAGSLCGFLSDRLGREITYTLGACCAALGLVALLLAVDPTQPWLLLAYTALFGFGLGLAGPAMSAAHADLFQGPHFGAINGLIVTGFGIGGTISPWLAGFVFDRTQTYVPSFLLAIGAILAACALMWVARPSAVRAVRRMVPEEQPASGAGVL